METREIKEKVLRIMALALEVSTIRESLDEMDYPDVFVSFTGNVSSLDVIVYENGFDTDVKPDRKWYVHLYEDDTPDRSKEYFNSYGCAVLDTIIAYLEGLKNA